MSFFNHDLLDFLTYVFMLLVLFKWFAMTTPPKVESWQSGTSKSTYTITVLSDSFRKQINAQIVNSFAKDTGLYLNKTTRIRTHALRFSCAVIFVDKDNKVSSIHRLAAFESKFLSDRNAKGILLLNTGDCLTMKIADQFSRENIAI